MSAAPAGTFWSVITDETGAQAAKVTVSYNPTTLALSSIVVENSTSGWLPLTISDTTGVKQTASLTKGKTTFNAKTLSQWGFSTLSDLQGISISTPE